MRKTFVIFTCLLIASSSFAQKKAKKLSAKTAGESFVQSYNEKSELEKYEPINLKSAIEQSFRLNYSEQERKFQREITKLNWQDTKEGFWLPQLSISLVTAEQRIARLKTGTLKNNPVSDAPVGTLSFNLGDYSLFNWGKDYLQYLSDKATYERDMQIFGEQRRLLRHRVIIKYFELVKTFEILKARRDQLRHASFMYRFNRERITLKKIQSQDYYQARMEYLKAQDLYQKAKADNRRVNDELVRILGDMPDTRYYLSQKLDFKKLKVTLVEAIDLARKRNPGILTSLVGKDNAQRDFEIQQRENLPLPEITMDLGAYDYSFSRSSNSTRYTTRAGDSQLEVVASINATWSITGPGGLFNRRTTHRKRVGKALASKRLENASHNAEVTTRRLFYQARLYEQDVEILQARETNATKHFDVIMENYMNKKARFVDFLHALEEKSEAAVALAESKWIHLSNKVNLANNMGVDDFPGERFESLAVNAKQN